VWTRDDALGEGLERPAVDGAAIAPSELTFSMSAKSVEGTCGLPVVGSIGEENSKPQSSLLISVHLYR
jgi:hypothetical protein